jgi:phosphohistidine phosphatase
MAELFAERKMDIDFMLSSPAVRAISTAHYFAEALRMPEQNIVQNKAIYDADVNDLLQIINLIPDKHSTVMMFGHNPGFSQMVHYLTGQPIEMPTCAIARIGFMQESWAHVSRNCGVLEDFDFPKKHLGNL